MVDHVSSLNPMKLLIDDHLFEKAGSPAFTATGVSVNRVHHTRYALYLQVSPGKYSKKNRTGPSDYILL